MQLFVSTTFYQQTPTNVTEVLRKLKGLDIDGVELGSTHIYRSDMEDVIKKEWDKRIVTHNFFPPTKDKNFVMNISSNNPEIRNQSVDHASYCLKVAANIGAEVYTVHPGFMATPNLNDQATNTYDFNFGSEKVKKEIAFSNMLESITRLIDVARENKIKLAIETEGSLTKPGILLMETMDEYEQLFSCFPAGIHINLNLAHTRFASIEHRYSVNEFINCYKDYICLVEVSHNNSKVDQHRPLNKGSFVFDHLSFLPDVPHILEFRNSSIEQIEDSVKLIRTDSNQDGE